MRFRTMVGMIAGLALLAQSALAQVTLTLGKPVEGTVRNAEIPYTLAVEEGEAYIVLLESTEFDGNLTINDARGNYLTYNDDFGDTTKSRVFFVAADDGEYEVVVGSYMSDYTGDYTLEASLADVTPLVAGETVVVENESLEQYYTFTGTAGTTINVIASNEDTAIDPALSLQLAGSEIAYDYDSGTEYFPAIRGFTLPEDATYVLVLNTSYSETLAGTSVLLEETEPLMLVDGVAQTLDFKAADYEVLNIPVQRNTQYRLTIMSENGSNTNISIDLTMPDETYAASYASVSTLAELSTSFFATSDGNVRLKLTGSTYDTVPVVVEVTEVKR